MLLKEDEMARRLSFDWLDLDVPPRVVFERPPLVLALCQIRFPSIFRINEQGWIAPFQEAIRNAYPIVSSVQSVQLSLVGPVAGKSSPADIQSWRFSDLNEDWTITLSTDSVAIETREYLHFNDFLDRLAFLIDAVATNIRPAVATRIGLRYVNEIRREHADWAFVVRPELLGPVAVPQFSTHKMQSIQQFNVRAEDGVGITINQGVVPEGAVIDPRQGQEVPTSPFYLLDFDVYQEFPTSTNTMPINSGIICERVDVFHGAASKLFRWSVTSGYLVTLGEQTDVAR